ncbi:lipase family alpha/beta hydrolase [Lysobacter enzymogenes]|uniref:lipase family alpha/beta hydrolase n=1 Tax=Lysobacter enzymogenes TaxID=69 RepID=UPI001A979A6B|nr:triacylglycerol lipase [Lysobacter enzymogenes]QQP95929.1 triacylglycerol lipase [Lysobacter enzymogenes]
MSRPKLRRLFAAPVLFVVLLLAAAFPASADDYTKTRYPVVLVHGLFGFDAIGGVYDYWFGIPQALRDGGAQVYVAQVSAANSNEMRGEQLIAQLETLKALHGYSKFNLVGHSQGGPTARYVASVRPDLVASMTSIGSPHAGSKVADFVGAVLPDGSPLRPLVASFVNAFSSLIGALSGGQSPQDSLAALKALDSAGSARFNTRYPQGKPATACGSGAAVAGGVRYYSFGGVSNSTNWLDLSDPAMIAGGLLFGGEANDGLVGRCSSHWGQVIRDDYEWNHLDEVNQIAGLRGVFSANPTSVYRAHLNRLKGAGL